MRQSLVPALVLLIAVASLSTAAPECRDRKDGRGQNRSKKGVEQTGCRERNSSKPAAHLTGVKPESIPYGQVLSWDHVYDMSFTSHNIEYKDSKVIVNSNGLYYVYCQVGFQGKKSNITLHSTVSVIKDRKEVILLNGSESVIGPTPLSSTWFASLSQGGLVDLKKGESLYVSVSHPDLVDYTESNTFFGLVKVS
uniref:Lymphotoxin beta n=1 Tax=Leptobrachium leishanense TaxID=445787 RepID=A0A8C5ML35_9ANUR